ADAARKAGVSEGTAYKRLKTPTFQARVRELRSEMVKTAAGKLADAMTEAAEVLRKLLDSSSEGIQLRAAVALMDQCVKVVELAELQERVEFLEGALKQQARR